MMKSPRPSKNQRVSKPRQRRQQHLLEVTVRRDVARVQRTRAVLAFVCKSILIVGFCVGAYLGGKEGLRRFLWENPDYFVNAEDIRVEGNSALTRDQILTTAGIAASRNIFTIDLARARAELDQLPQVERAELRRVLPNRISVTITERRPIAWVCQHADDDPTLSEKSFLIDARGVVMRSKTILAEYLHLPVISGVEVENLAPGQKVRSFEMQAALDLIRINADNNRFQPRNLDLARGYCVVVTDQEHRKITFGLDRVDLQIDRLMRYLDFLEPTGKEIQTVNLLIERNTPITFAAPLAEADEIPVPPLPKSDSSKDKTGKEKAAVTTRKAEAVSTPTPAPHSNPQKESTPAGRKRVPAESVKKPFRLHG
jgi:cell division septal protein FtsQ